MTDHGEKKKGKEESSSSNQVKEIQDKNLEEMDKLIKSLLSKLIELELENKILPIQSAQAPNRGFNPWYQRQSLQIL